MFSLFINLKKLFIVIELKNVKILKKNNTEKFISLTYQHFKVYSIFEEYEVIIRFLTSIIFEHSSRKTMPKKNYIFSQFYELFFLEYTEILKIVFRILYFAPIKYLDRNNNLKNNPNKISNSIKNKYIKLSNIKKNEFFLPIFIYCFYVPKQYFPINRLELNQKNMKTDVQKGRKNIDAMEKALLFLKLPHKQNFNFRISDTNTKPGYGKAEIKLFPIDNINMINFNYSKKIKFFSKKNDTFFVLTLFYLEFFINFKQFFGGSFTQFKPILKRAYKPVNLDIQFNMFDFWTTLLSKTKDRIPILRSLLKFTQSKKIMSGEKTFFGFLEKGFIYFWILKYNHQKKLLFFFHDLENIFGKYGKKTFYWFLKKSNLKFLTPKNFLSDFIILETLKYFGIIYNPRAHLNIRDFKNSSNLHANNIFTGNHLIYNGIKKFFHLFGGSFSNLKTKRDSKYTKFAIWANLILGTSGKIELFLFFSLKILKKWDFINRKLFWKNWLLREILQTAKKSRNKLLSIRCKYFFLTKANLFYENFFK